MIVLARRMDWACQSLDSLTGRIKGTSAGLAITGVPCGRTRCIEQQFREQRRGGPNNPRRPCAFVTAFIVHPLAESARHYVRIAVSARFE